MKNEFDNEIKYKLYRNVREILHPSISKKNISDYKIIIDEEILPVRVFYPKKITGVDKIIIYIHGNGKITDCEGKYTNICKMLVEKTNYILVAIEYPEYKDDYLGVTKEIFNTLKFLYKEFERNGIDCENIILMGDSTGGNIITGINYLNDKEINIKKEILFYPILNIENYLKKQKGKIKRNIYDYYHYVIANDELFSDSMFNVSKHENVSSEILLLCGNADELKEEAINYAERFKKVEYVNMPFSEHGFLGNNDKEMIEELSVELNKFLGL